MTIAKVLLVDDEKDFAKTLAERLELRGHAVFTAASGPEALELAGQHRFDAVILDLQMPGMDGIETLKLLVTGDPDQQIIILTGHATVQKGVEAMKAGATEFLEKPVETAVLVDKIGAAAAKRTTLLMQRSAADIDNLLKKKGW